jgi:LysM repeat protein
MGRGWWVFLVSLVLVGMITACLSDPEVEDVELRPTFILTPYATVTFTPTPVPLQSPTPTPVPTPEMDVYVVVPGDTLGGIAVQYDISVQEFMILNGLSSGDILSVGQELRVPKR